MMEINVSGLTFNVGDNNSEFWTRVNSNTWEKDSFRIFDRFIDGDTVYFDIGAWIGPTVLYAGQKAKKSFAFEPDPVAYGIISENLAMNGSKDWAGRITLYNKAVSTEEGYINIGSRSGGGDSLSSSLFAANETSWKVESVSVPTIIKSNGLTGEKMLFKIDIEGGEYTLIPALKETLGNNRSVLFLSFHPGNLFSSLNQGNESFPKKVKSWREVVKTHCRMTGTLPYSYRYLQSGRKLNLFNLLYYVLRLRSFSIVASNEKW